MRNLAFAAYLFAVSACGTDTDANVSARIGWILDYSDYTDNEAAERLRACDNAGDGAVSSVRLSAVDPQGQVRGFESEYECTEGLEQPVPIRGVAEGPFELSAEARVGDRVWYRRIVSNVRFDGALERLLRLRAVVGELRFRPLLDGSFACDPAAVDRIRVSLFPLEDGAPEGSPLIERVIAEPCDGGFFTQVALNGVPAEPASGSTGFVLRRYRVEARAEGPAGSTLGCASFERAIPPGDGSAVSSDESLTTAQCP